MMSDLEYTDSLVLVCAAYVTVFKVAILDKKRVLQRKLNRISGTADTETKSGLNCVLKGTIFFKASICFFFMKMHHPIVLVTFWCSFDFNFAEVVKSLYEHQNQCRFAYDVYSVLYYFCNLQLDATVCGPNQEVHSSFSLDEHNVHSYYNGYLNIL